MNEDRGGLLGDKVRYSSAAMDEATQNFATAAQQLENTIEARRRDVAVAMSAYEATGVSDEYAEKERQWAQSADRVVAIIAKLRSGMREADSHASDANARVKAIGQGL